jgi:hypothetical protein
MEDNQNLDELDGLIYGYLEGSDNIQNRMRITRQAIADLEGACIKASRIWEQLDPSGVVCAFPKIEKRLAILRQGIADFEADYDGMFTGKSVSLGD